MVRARLAAHLRNLQERFPALAPQEILTLPDCDYRYRLILPKQLWADALAALALEQDWSNFKNEAAKFNGHDDYVSSLHKVWGIMYEVQHQEGK